MTIQSITTVVWSQYSHIYHCFTKNATLSRLFLSVSRNIGNINADIMIKIRKISFSLLVMVMFSVPSQLTAMPPQFLIVGTAGPTGVYYPVGNTICRTINKERKMSANHAIHCHAAQSEGSLSNLNSLKAGEMDLALIQADVLNGFYQNSNTQPSQLELRTLLRLYRESLAIVVRKDSGINSVQQLIGKRVHLGREGSGQRYTMSKLLEVSGLQESDLLIDEQVTQQQLASALCAKQLDAFAFMTGHPAALLKQVSNECDTQILNIDRTTIERLTNLSSVYQLFSIPAQMYQGNESIETVSVQALLVTTTGLDNAVVTHVIENIMKNIKSVKLTHPALETFDNDLDGVIVPMHDVSKAFFAAKK